MSQSRARMREDHEDGDRETQREAFAAKQQQLFYTVAQFINYKPQL